MNILEKIDFSLIDKQGFQVLYEYGANIEQFIQLFKNSNYKVYFSDRMDTDFHYFFTKPYSKILAESPENGGFHTDFSWDQNAPRYIALLCLAEDPKSPYFALNQVVCSQDLCHGLMRIFDFTREELLAFRLPYLIGDDKWRNIFYEVENEKRLMLRYHHSFVDHQLALNHKISGYPISYLFNALCNQFSQVVLNKKGNILIIDNHFALHKRTEATVCFETKYFFKSRELVTLRFDKE